jgi:hypothetical protein
MLNDTFRVVEHHIRNAPCGELVPQPDMSYKLPVGLPNYKEACIASTGLPNLPEGVRPVDESTEKLIISALLLSLKESIGIAVSSDPSTSRTPANSKSECCDYVIIGGSHASLLVTQMRAKGLPAQLLYLPDYRASSVNAGKLKERLDAMKISATTVLVLQAFDNGFYMTFTKQGDLVPLHKDADGALHVEGELVLAPKEIQWKLFAQIAGELSNFKNNNLVILAPLPRYLEKPCCQEVEHLINRGKQDFKKKLEDSIFQSRTSLKDFAFRSGFRKVKTISTWGAVRKIGATWADPIHLSPEGYSAIVEAIEDALEEIGNKRKGDTLDSSTRKKARADQPPASASSTRASRAGRGGVRGRGGHWRDSQQYPNQIRGGHAGWHYAGRGWSRGQHRGRGFYN